MSVQLEKASIESLPEGQFDIIYADPPWPMWGDPNKNAAAGKHYKLMTIEEINSLPVRNLVGEQGAIFLWATCPRLDVAIAALKAWGFHYRGVAFVWVKTTQNGNVIHGQGIPPTSTKPTTELCLFGTIQKVGRPFPLLDAKIPQVVFSSRGAHSQKPPIIRKLIERMYGKKRLVELFARDKNTGWESWGDEVGTLSDDGADDWT